MFEQFEELESVEEPAAPVGVAILDDKVFRFAVYDKIQTPVKAPFFIGRSHFCTPNLGIW